MKRAHIKTIVDHHGGAKAFAAMQDPVVSAMAVYNWIKANSLPLDRAIFWAEKLGIDRDYLHDPWVGRWAETLSPEETKSLLTSL